MPKPKHTSTTFVARLHTCIDELSELCGELDAYTRNAGALELAVAEKLQRVLMLAARDATQSAVALNTTKDIARNAEVIAQLATDPSATVRP